MVHTPSIRMKLLMAALTLVLSLMASVALMGVTADAANAQVTEIRQVKNDNPYWVYIWNHESGARKSIGPGNTWDLNQNVPWATNRDEFHRGKFIEVGYFETGPVQCGRSGTCPRLAIWQQGSYIRYDSTDRGQPMVYLPDGPQMNGDSTVGGRRNLTSRPPVLLQTLRPCKHISPGSINHGLTLEPEICASPFIAAMAG